MVQSTSSSETDCVTTRTVRFKLDDERDSRLRDSCALRDSWAAASPPQPCCWPARSDGRASISINALRTQPAWKFRIFSPAWASQNSAASNTSNFVRAIGESVEQQKPSILSLGGGTTAQPRNIAHLRENRAVLIWLQCAIEELLLRCAQITNRPLFRDEASFRKLYQDRLPSYELSDYRVDGGASLCERVEQILALGIFPKVTV